jgi:transcriptional regulator with XRE-family HTH domain
MRSDQVGEAIRALRLQRGWSLAELARRAGTSAPTVHRYESGWRRFEVHTLEKLAVALGCRLDVRFLPPASPTDDDPITARKIAPALRRLFWDRRLCPSDLDRYPQWVVRRVLEYGALDDVRGLVRYYGRDAFLELVARTRLESRRTRAFWDGILHLEGHECTTRFSRAEADACWTP